MSEKISFVYFGSGPVAAENLRQLREQFSVEAIITKPTTEQEMRVACPDTPLYCVASKQELDTLIEKHRFSSKVGVLIDFGIIVSRRVIDHFEKGIVNSHFSLLPQWRGADPITFSILSGQDRTGVSLMLLVEAMDEGPILSSGVYELKGDETTPQLTDHLIRLSTDLLQNSLPKYMDGSIQPTSQDDVAQSLAYSASPTYSRKLTKQDGAIDWTKPAEQLAREIRAFAGWPKSRATLGNVDVILTKAITFDGYELNTNIGTPVTPDAKTLLVQCGDGSVLSILKLKPAGKNEMDVQAFLAGYANRLTV